VRKRRASAPWARGVRGVVEVRKGAGRVCEGGAGGGGAGGPLAVGGGEGMATWWWWRRVCDYERCEGGRRLDVSDCRLWYGYGVELSSACTWCWRASAGRNFGDGGGDAKWGVTLGWFRSAR